MSTSYEEMYSPFCSRNAATVPEPKVVKSTLIAVAPSGTAVEAVDDALVPAELAVPSLWHGKVRGS